METRTQASLLSLPTEMLDEIFSFLKTEDIRSLRRVNKRFNQILNQSVYCENDVFHWKKVNNTRRIIKLLNGSKRSVFNLHIDGVHFEDDFVISTFFKKHGSKVHSLSFYDCSFRRLLLQNIILKCTAMRSFSYVTSRKFVPLVVFDDFRKFETQSIVLEEVTSLRFVLGRNHLDDFTLRRFMAIFPNVTRLDIRIPFSTFPSPDSNSDSDSNSESDREFYFPDCDCSSCCFSSASEDDSAPSLDIHNRSSNGIAVYDCILQMSNSLQWLRTNLPLRTLSNLGDSFFEALPNLNYLSLDLKDFRLGEIDVSKWRTPLQCFPWLEIERPYNNPVANIVQKLNPRHLISDSKGPTVNYDSFLKLLQSDAQTVELIHKWDWTFNPIRFPYSPNTILTDLNVRNSNENAFTSVALYPIHFKALIHLKLEMVSNKILQLIFKNQKNLRSLFLGDCRTCDLNGFTGANNEKQLSIRELQNLEHLTIGGFKVSMVKSERFVDAFQFPRLKYLYIEADQDYTVIEYSISKSLKLPVSLFESMENLEALRLSNLGKASSTKLKTLCRNLKHLRYLNYNCEAIHPGKICIVDLSKSTFEDLSSKNDRSSYDEGLKKTVLINKSFNCTFFSPKISSFVIDWIVF